MRIRQLTSIVLVLGVTGCPGRDPGPNFNPVSAAPDTAATPVEGDAEQPAVARLAYPQTERQDMVDTLHGVQVADPYRWLENVEDDRVQAWMTAEGDLARDYLDAVPAREPLHRRLTELYYYDDVSAPEHRSGRFFYSRRHKDKEKRIYYWKQGEGGAETVLIDPNTLSDDGSVSVGGVWPSHDGKRVAYKLKENNADEATLYVMDVATGATSKVDVITGAKYGAPAWTPDNKAFYYTKLPMDPSIPVADRPGHAHVRYHVLGSDPAADPTVYPATMNPQLFVNADLSRDGRYLFVYIQHGWNAVDVYVKDLKTKRGAKRGAKQRVAAKSKAPIPAWQEYGFTPLVEGIPSLFYASAWKGSFYVLTNHEAPRYRVFKVNPKQPALAKWKQIVPETDAVLENAQVVGNHLVLSYMRDAHNEMEVHTLDGALVRKVQLPGIGSTSGMVGNEDEDAAYFGYSSFAQAPRIYKTSIKTGQTDKWAETVFPVDTSKMTVEQVRYPSKDGTEVTMFLIRRSDAAKDGNNPTLLYGYGGFNVSLTPFFSTSYVVWLERGGMLAIPNLRGGGEYGEDWHKAGMLLDKQNVFDDFVYAAKYLIGESWTRPERLAISGGSNGGLLVGAAMTQAPELFKAVVCAVPLLDMVRYHLFGSGKTWIPEYGSAEDPAQFAALHAYSPYHHVAQGVRYPALLMLSADSDDRVDPMHARKFVAAMQAATSGDGPVLLRIERNAGHSGADLVKQRVDHTADTYAFLIDQLGM